MLTKLSEVVEAGALLQEDHPEREYFLYPLLFPGSIGMLYAPPGVGKTFFALWLAAACSAGGEFLRWTGVCATKVLYVDAEMSSVNLVPRVKQIALSANFSIPKGNLFFTAPDRFTNFEVPRISEPSGQEWYSNQLRVTGAKVLIIDNLLTASTPRARENDLELWSRIQPWLIQLRSQGIAIVIVHHAGKSGSQLGSMRHEVILNWTISLQRPGDYQQTDGARFEIHFKKGRDFVGEESEPMACQMVDNGSEVSWNWKFLKQEIEEIIKKMHALKMTEAQIAKEAGTSIFKVKSVLQGVKFGLEGDSAATTGPATRASYAERAISNREDERNEFPF
jgi:hypothetical protein